MENLTSEQKRIFNRFLKVFSTENSLQSLEKFLGLIEDGQVGKTFNEINQLKQKIQGDSSHGEISIEETIENVRESYRRIDEIYRKIFDIEQEGEFVQSSVLNEIEEIKKFTSEMGESYHKFYGSKDSEGNITEGIISKLNEACQEIENNQAKMTEFQEYYSEVFEGIPADENGQGKKPSLKEFLDQKKQEFQEVLKKSNEEIGKFKQESRKSIDERIKQIEGLLPSATSAGLATAYKQEKEDIQKELKVWRRIFWISVICFLMCFGVYFWVTFDESFSYMTFFRSLPFWIFSSFFYFLFHKTNCRI